MISIPVKQIYVYIMLLMTFFSCKSFLDVGEPINTISAGYVYKSDEATAAVLTGIYFDLQRVDNWAQGESGISIRCGLSADEVGALSLSRYDVQYKNISSLDFWTKIYNTIYKVNAAIEGISNSSSLSTGVKKQLLGEASFLRAFCYFYLVNLYGDVPLLVVSDYRVNALASRTSSQDIYEQILVDLNTAESNLSDQFLDANVVSYSNERIRPTKSSAYALLARIYLFLGNWENAILNASKIIDNKSLFDIVSLNEVFLKNSKEAIWQLQAVDIDGVFQNTLDARILIPLEKFDVDNNPLYVSSQLLSSFEKNDKRKENWIKVDSSISTDHMYFYKYKLAMSDQASDEYVMVLRLGEQYLIRAEARAEMGDIEGAKMDLNTIRRRAGLENTIFNTQAALLEAIVHERQTELFIEWGHRWLDLKRTKRIDGVMDSVAQLKGGTWSPFKALFPIPIGEISLNPNLTQNTGYPGR